jgi:2-polyprenyl-3-methyl-5-hydroxy-6-metoxy-1,4-benzoquinol methylase
MLLKRNQAIKGKFYATLLKQFEGMVDQRKIACWVCGETDFKLMKPSDVSPEISSKNFAITNFEYGKTGELRKCNSCGFIQCTDLEEVIKFYVELEDPEYENTRHERRLQEERLVRFFRRYKKQGRLLDIGAGSGIMIEAALAKGFDPIGIEPSKWLQKKAADKNLPVVQGLFPHPEVKGPFDIITLVDVLEHITNPADLLRNIHKELGHDGIFILVTPDVNSLAAKIFGYRWWHYRFAHLGYFNKNTLTRLLDKTGFEIITIRRPSWYFTLKYLGVRFLSFFPKFMQFPIPNFLEKVTIPVNLRDSILAVCKKNKNND